MPFFPILAIVSLLYYLLVLIERRTYITLRKNLIAGFISFILFILSIRVYNTVSEGDKSDAFIILSCCGPFYGYILYNLFRMIFKMIFKREPIYGKHGSHYGNEIANTYDVIFTILVMFGSYGLIFLTIEKIEIANFFFKNIFK